MSTKTQELTSLYQNHAVKLYRFFYYKTFQTEIAEDLTSETFLQLAASLAKQKQTIENPTAYLYGIAKYIFLNYLRTKYKESEIIRRVDDYEILSFEQYVPEYIASIEDIPTLEDKARPFIEQLPTKQKELMQLRLLEKMTPTQISKHLGKDLNYVKTTLKRGNKNLKRLAGCTPFVTNNTETYET